MAGPSTVTGSGVTLRRLSDGPAFGLWAVPGTGEVYYLTLEGSVMDAKEGPDLEISSQPMQALNRIIPSADGSEVLAAFGNPAAPSWGIFSLTDKAWHPLPTEITEAAWGWKPNQLLVLMKVSDLTSLATADISKTPIAYAVILKDFRLKDVHLQAESPQDILIYEKPSANLAGHLWELDSKTLAWNLLLKEEQGLTLGWSTDGSLLFKYSPSQGFVILNNQLGIALPAPFTTFPSKCASIASSTAFCFVPQNLPTPGPSVSLPDDYFMRTLYTIDNLYQVTSVGGSSKLFTSFSDSFPAIDAENPVIVAGSVYFRNRYDNFIYELTVPVTP